MQTKNSEEPKVPSNPLPAILFGLLVVVGGLGGFAAWAGTAQLSSAIIASGTLKVVTNRKKVQVPETGVVKELLVKNGDRVEVGQVILRLDDTRATAAVNVAQSSFDLAAATVARLRAERDGLEAPEFPQEILERSDEAAVSEIMKGQLQVFSARRKELEGQDNMLTERIGQLQEEIIGLKAQSNSRAKQIELIKEELLDLKKLLEKGLTQRDRVLSLERETARLEGEKGESDAGIARARRLIAESELEGIQLRTSFERSVRDELATREAEMYGLADRLVANRHTLEQLEIRAPENGYVVGLEVYTVGGVVRPAEVLMEIVPTKDSLIIEAQVRPVDIEDIFVGQNADINFSAFAQHELPKLSGLVSYVSADVFTDPKTQGYYYTAQIKVDEKELGRISEITLLPGMPADVFMRTKDRTPLSYLTQPLQQSFDKAWREP